MVWGPLRASRSPISHVRKGVVVVGGGLAPMKLISAGRVWLIITALAGATSIAVADRVDQLFPRKGR